MTSPYHLLGLPPTATLSDVKKRYRRLALSIHPDKSPSKDAHQHFVLLHNAYEMLLKTAPDKALPSELPSRNDIWHEEEEHPSFGYLDNLGKHLFTDAQEVQDRHYEMVSMLRQQGRSGYEQYTNFVGTILSKVLDECEALRGRCLTLNADAWTETELWMKRMKRVRQLQSELTNLLTSIQVVWREIEEIKAKLEGKGTLSAKEWDVVMGLLSKMANCL